jgi:hypothetical protein
VRPAEASGPAEAGAPEDQGALSGPPAPPAPAGSAPDREYEARLAARRAEEARLRRLDLGIANARLAVFLGAGVLTWLAFVSRVLSVWWLVLALAGFVVLVILHDRVARRRRRFAAATAFYEQGLARLSGTWIGRGATGESFRDRTHPYTEDLDLFGKGSLFELLCTARTASGEQALAAWLAGPAALAEIRSRQEAIGELAGMLDVREALAVVAGASRHELSAAAIEAWAGDAGAWAPRFLLPIARVLAALGLAALAGWILAGTGPLPTIAILVTALLLEVLVHRRLRRAIAGLERPGPSFQTLARILRLIEEGRFAAARLRSLQESLRADGAAPSHRIAALARLIDMQEWSRNVFFAPLAILLCWDIQLSFAIDDWRRRHGVRAAEWLSVVGEIEALASLASHAYEHPADPFPEIVDTPPLFEAEGIGHPLIPDARCVRNDVRLDGSRRLLVVSGSNMSGKSTLLRTVGTNAVLALAGAPVRARRLIISPLAVGASIRIQDSLLDGTSRFYAEILRIRQLMELAEGLPPLLFLIDEILHGTNSHDRRIGAETILRGLTSRGAVGLATTHDLALSQIVETMGEAAANVHFQDHMEEGRIAFDYTLHPGVVTRSNALDLMRAVGLSV